MSSLKRARSASGTRRDGLVAEAARQPVDRPVGVQPVLQHGLGAVHAGCGLGA